MAELSLTVGLLHRHCAESQRKGFTELKKLLRFGALQGAQRRTVRDGIGLRKVAYPSVA